MRTLLLTLPAAALLAGCGASVASPALHDAAAVTQVTQALLARHARGYGGQKRPCESFFEIADVRVADKQVSEGTAKVEVTFAVRSKQRIDAEAFASRGCYGAPPDGWSVGEIATSRETFRFERWDSGWRLIP